MAQNYNNFRVLNYDESKGEVELAWYDDNFPFVGQRVHVEGHKIPEEAETNTWDRAQYLAYWVQQIATMYDIPQFLKDEADHTRSEFVLDVTVLS
jgi:hypothetical protein